MLRTNKFFNLRDWRIAKLSVLLVLISFGFGACKHDIVKPDLLSDYEVNTYSDVFEIFWKGINTNYVYWEQDPLNWDSIHAVYKPKFAAIDTLSDQNAAQNMAFQYMVDMTKNLKDGNYSLTVNNGGDFVFQDSSYKSMLRFVPKLMANARTHPVLPDTLFDYVIQHNYLNDFDYGQYRDMNTLQIFQAITGSMSKCSKNIEYLGLNSFMMKVGYNQDYSTRPPVRPVMKNFFSAIRQPSCDGFVLDLRNNRGGNLEDIDFFVGQLTTKPLLFGYVRYKSGSGRLDYTPTVPMYVQPQTGAVDFKKKIVILTDSYTASLSEKVIMALKALPGATVVTIGDPTYGSMGLMGTNEIATNSGSFNIPNFGAVSLSNLAVQDTKHQFTIGAIAPDVKVSYDAAGVTQMLKTGVDIQMEAAVRYLNQQ
jgi:hypothetical protein